MEDIFLGSRDPLQLLEKYGSPLYVYREDILRERCRQIRSMIPSDRFVPQYSAKANTNITLLKIIHQEGMGVDAMSIGEVLREEKAGFQKEEIMYCANNMTQEEMRFAHDHAGNIILDSLCQVELYGQLFPGAEIGIRINPGIGDGHSDKVITGGNTKFGIPLDDAGRITDILQRYHLRLTVLHQHVGSQFLDDTIFLRAAETLLKVARQFPDVMILDFGGGFGVPYHHEKRLDLSSLGSRLLALVQSSEAMDKRHYQIRVEPGRYIVAECGQLLGTVTDLKQNGRVKYLGTDIGFQVFMRPVLYQAEHRIHGFDGNDETDEYTVCGNICESGDVLARNLLMAKMHVGDAICVEDAGAYGYCMASNYNCRPRPAEILLSGDSTQLIRHRERYEQLAEE